MALAVSKGEQYDRSEHLDFRILIGGTFLNPLGYLPSEYNHAFPVKTRLSQTKHIGITGTESFSDDR